MQDEGEPNSSEDFTVTWEPQKPITLSRVPKSTSLIVKQEPECTHWPPSRPAQKKIKKIKRAKRGSKRRSLMGVPIKGFVPPGPSNCSAEANPFPGEGDKLDEVVSGTWSQKGRKWREDEKLC